MCVVSMVGDWGKETIPDLRFPWVPESIPYNWTPAVSRQEFDALKREVEALRSLLERAQQYDRQNNEPNCETEDKMQYLKNLADAVGVDLSEILDQVS